MNKAEMEIVKELNKAKHRDDQLFKTKKLATRATLKCPTCQSEDIKVLEAKRSLFNLSNALYLFGGLLLIIGMTYIAKDPSFTQGIWIIVLLFGYLTGAVLIWDGALGLGAPPPFSWFEGFGTKTYELQSKCHACNGNWSRNIRLQYLEHSEFADVHAGGGNEHRDHSDHNLKFHNPLTHEKPAEVSSKYWESASVEERRKILFAFYLQHSDVNVQIETLDLLDNYYLKNYYKKNYIPEILAKIIVNDLAVSSNEALRQRADAVINEFGIDLQKTKL